MLGRSSGPLRANDIANDSQFDRSQVATLDFRKVLLTKEFMTSVKAKLVVLLKANDVVVAEVEDPALWQSVLTAINGSGAISNLGGTAPFSAVATPSPALDAPAAISGQPQGRLARELGIDLALVEGALSPALEAPYLHLNSHNWEAMRKQLPVRGPTAISPIVAAATLVALWFRAAGLGNPTQAQALAVLETIGENDRNPSRGVRSATWLIARPGGQIQLNASEISMANKLGTAFCSKTWAAWGKSKAKSSE